MAQSLAKKNAGRTDSSTNLEEYRAVFRLFDRDNSGSIGKSELSYAIRALGVDAPERQLQDWIAEIDADGDGEISFDEFCQCLDTMSKKKQSEEEVIQKCYSVFDGGLTGYVTESEFQRILVELGEIAVEDAQELFREVDVDGNGRVDYNEFEQMVKRFLFRDD